MPKPKQGRRTVKIADPSYQPSKAELNEDMRVDASPEDIARAVGRQVEVRHSKPNPPKGETLPTA